MAEHPRDELRRRIAHVLRNMPDPEHLAHEVTKLFHRIGERYEDLDVTTVGSVRTEIWRQRWIVAELAREGEPERIEGAWRG
jgi:hypothetical protein